MKKVVDKFWYNPYNENSSKNKNNTAQKEEVQAMTKKKLTIKECKERVIGMGNKPVDVKVYQGENKIEKIIEIYAVSKEHIMFRYVFFESDFTFCFHIQADVQQEEINYFKI